MAQKTQIKGILLLLITAIIWGSSFVSQSIGMDNVDAFTFMGIRTVLGATFLLPFILVRGHLQYVMPFSLSRVIKLLSCLKKQ